MINILYHFWYRKKRVGKKKNNAVSIKVNTKDLIQT